jgi:uncharacterized protein YcgL (UPF0745 family)
MNTAIEQTVSITIHQLHINEKQLTPPIFEQIPIAFPFDSEGDFIGSRRLGFVFYKGTKYMVWLNGEHLCRSSFSQMTYLVESDHLYELSESLKSPFDQPAKLMGIAFDQRSTLSEAEQVERIQNKKAILREKINHFISQITPQIYLA